MISDILVESELLNSLRFCGKPESFIVTKGLPFSGLDLVRTKLVPQMLSIPSDIASGPPRNIPVPGFSTMFQAELVKAVTEFLETSVRNSSRIDPAWMRGRVLPSLADLQREDKKKLE